MPLGTLLSVEMTPLTKLTEWEGPEIRLVKLQGLPTAASLDPAGDRSLYRVEGRRVEEVFVCQTGGARAHGTSAAYQYAEWMVARGHLAQPHTFFIPSTLESVKEKFEVYRCWDDNWITPHTAGCADRAVSICMAGRFRSRHAYGDERATAPDPEAMEALVSLIDDYLVPRYGLKTGSLRGAFDAGCPADPGDYIEHWIRRRRGEVWEMPPIEAQESLRPLRTPSQREIAVSEVTRTVLGRGPFAWAAALEDFQKSVPWLRPTGRWDAPTARAVRIALAAEEDG